MKKLSIISFLLVVASIFPAKADEGMWLLPFLKDLNAEKMAEMGFTLTPEQIYDINNSSIKDAIVQFAGGCTGEIVSNQGLLFTNHHCGYGAIQALSSVEHDYLKDGFWAMNLGEELPAPGISVSFMESFNDVTEEYTKIMTNLGKIKKEKKAASYYKKSVDKLKKKYTEGLKNVHAEIESFYGGNMYFLIVYKTYTDVRLVGTPPSSIGKFGADTDNWMWPRHTGDFCVFRVYADRNNQPAEYSVNNVPYTPKNFLKISIAEIEENDPTFIMGYPGRTNRFMTHAELIETRDILNDIRIEVRGIRQDKMMEDMEADPQIRIQYSNKYAGSSNGWKKWIGMNETFKKLNVAERRAEDEKKFMEWVNEDPIRVSKYGTALEKISNSIDATKEAKYLSTYLSESLLRSELGSVAYAITGMLSRDDYSEGTKNRTIEGLQTFYKDYSVETDKKITKAMIEVYRDNVPAEKRPTFYTEIDSQFGGDINAYVDYMFENSRFTNLADATTFIDQCFEEKSKSNVSVAENDPASRFYDSARKPMIELSSTISAHEEAFNQGKKEYIAGTLEMNEGKAMYPDANFTMRLTYGSVLPYSPRDAVKYDYFTTLDGVMEKEDPNNWEFVVPAKLKELWLNQDFGRYAMKNGKMPLAFLSNNDITGGNSGSPIMNANGELIGLAFDGNWESMSGDIIFEPFVQRTINVDSRYVLFIIDKFGGASWLLDEMVIVE